VTVHAVDSNHRELIFSDPVGHNAPENA
jgi:hypothetical protein